MASKANFALGAPLPFYPGENVTGAYLTLTQSPCNNPWRKGLCCGYPRESAGKEARAARSPICSNWTGAHAQRARTRGSAPAAPQHARCGTLQGCCCLRMSRTLGAEPKRGAPLRPFAGAHLISRGCILYGTLTMEMAMRMPRGTMGAPATRAATHCG
jgi:hypothetical protein